MGQSVPYGWQHRPAIQKLRATIARFGILKVLVTDNETQFIVSHLKILVLPMG